MTDDSNSQATIVAHSCTLVNGVWLIEDSEIIIKNRDKQLKAESEKHVAVRFS